MKKSMFLISGLIIANGLFSQNVQNNNDVIFVKCSDFSVSKAVRDLPDAIQTGTFTESNDEHDRRHLPPIINPNAINEDKAVQKSNGTKSISATIKNWQGQSGNSCPPDPSGAAGLTQYAQAVNLSFRVYNKSTGAPLIAAKDLKSFWPGSLDDGDPIVLYDKAADRWFISQFQVSDNTNKIHIAISTTNDATGTYNLFTFVPASNDTPDYPKFSIWSDGYYMTSNYSTPRIVVFDRTKMLAGNSSAGMIVKTLPSPITGGFFCPLAGDASDSQLPPSTVTYCPIFSYEDDSWGAPHDQLRIWKMHVDFTTPANTTIASDQTLPTQPFDAASFSQSWDDISQPGTNQKIDAIAGVLNYRAQYRRWNGYNTVTICHAVKINTNPGQVGIRWYELRQNQMTNVWSIYQQSTLAPDGLSRWMGSIGMDDNGNIAMSYCVSGSTAPNYYSLRYTGRLATDSLNQMTFAEQTAIASTSSLTSCQERDGDYTQLMLDPDGQTFWHTGEYVVSNSPATRIYSFQLSIPPVASFTTSSTNCVGNAVTMTDNSTGTPTSWSWTLIGGTPSSSASQNPSVTYSTAGTYTVTLVSTNSLGSSAPVSHVITVNASPTVPTISTSPSGNSFSSSSTTSNQWYANGVLINGATNQTFTTTSSGSYTVVVTNSFGCSSTSSPINYANNNAPTASFIASTNNCSGQPITLTDNSTNTPTSWNWTLTGGSPASSTSQSPSVNYSTAGTYTVTLVSTNSSGSSAPVTQTVSINSTPPVATISPNGNTLTSSSNTGNQWYLNGGVINGATNQVYTATVSGSYSVVVTNSFGCKSTSPSTNLTTTGINSFADNNMFTIFPNPSNGIVTLNFIAKSEVLIIEVFNDLGQLVFMEKINDCQKDCISTIDLSSYKHGIYLFRITADQNIYTKKVLLIN